MQRSTTTYQPTKLVEVSPWNMRYEKVIVTRCAKTYLRCVSRRKHFYLRCELSFQSIATLKIDVRNIWTTSNKKVGEPSAVSRIATTTSTLGKPSSRRYVIYVYCSGKDFYIDTTICCYWHLRTLFNFKHFKTLVLSCFRDSFMLLLWWCVLLRSSFTEHWTFIAELTDWTVVLIT